MNSSDKTWLFMTLIFGFYATFDLLTSHIFHLGLTSFQVGRNEINNVRTLKIMQFKYKWMEKSLYPSEMR